MKKLMAAALFAATALPGLAQAQDWRGGDHPHGDHGAQAQRPASQQQARPQAPQPGPRPQPAPGGFEGGRRFDRGQQPGLAPQGAQPFQRPEGRGFDGGRRFDRGQQPFNGGQAQPFGRADGGRRFDRGQPDGAQPFARPDGRFDQGQHYEGARDGDPRRFDRGQPRFGDRAFDAQRQGYAPAYRPDQARNPYRYDGGRAPFAGGYRAEGERGGGQWNRGWRADRRYDWSGYRRGHDELFRLPRYSAPYGWNYGYQRFGVGIVIDEGLFARDYWIDDPYEYRLPPVDGPYRWVRYYGDALLVDIYTGEVVDTVYGIFG